MCMYTCTGKKRASRETGTMVYEVYGDMTTKYTKSTDMLVHIVNCVAMIPRKNSLCHSIIKRYGYSNVYAKRKALLRNLAHKDSRPTPGTVEFSFPADGSPDMGPIVANCFSQYRMGNFKSQYYMNSMNVDKEYVTMSRLRDTYWHRLEYFKMCVFNEIIPFIIKKEKIVKRIVFPKYIGCGVADGKWPDYHNVIVKLEKKLSSYGISVFIVQKNIKK